MEDLARALRDEAVAIGKEMGHRLKGDISDNDATAIESAIAKAVFEGANQGRADAAAQVIKQLGDIEFNMPRLVSPDPWAERYGGDA